MSSEEKKVNLVKAIQEAVALANSCAKSKTYYECVAEAETTEDIKLAAIHISETWCKEGCSAWLKKFCSAYKLMLERGTKEFKL